MPAFAWSSQFREGQWRAFRRFMLEERRDASARYAVINAEKERIGSIRIIFEMNADNKRTERRVGIAVTPQDSSLAKLLAAYTSLGGNPFDISMFMAPDKSVSQGEEVKPTAPSGGVLHQQDIKYAYDQGVTDGDVSLMKYRTSRIGGKHVTAKEFEVLGIVQRGRKWITQEIRQKRTRIEEQIIKLCDLREQLDEEVEDLLWATYGDMIADHGFKPERFNDSLTAANIAYFFDSTFRIPDEGDPTMVPVDNEAESGKPGSVNTGVLGGYSSLISDEDEEDNTAL